MHISSICENINDLNLDYIVVQFASQAIVNKNLDAFKNYHTSLKKILKALEGRNDLISVEH